MRRDEANDYFDFDVLIESAEDGYRTRILNSPVGQATARLDLPFSDVEVENFVLRLNRPRRGVRRLETQQMEAAKEFGGLLFNSVFRDQVLSALQSSLNEARQNDAGLRIRLRLSDAPELLDLPWEYLYDAAQNHFLSLSVESPLIRYLDLPGRIEPLAVKPPLRVLVMISSPDDYPPLDVEQEWTKLKESVKDLEEHGLLTLHRLAKPTLAEMRRQMRRRNFHVFHFIGHGGFDEVRQDGILVLEDENKRSRMVSGQDLGILLHDEKNLRLAVLNSCEGGRTSRSDPFAGVGQSLLQQGIPAVIAMQFEISDEAAITLSHEFYFALADGYPVDAALAEARKGIFAEGNDVEWGTPVLYLRAPDGRIFDVDKIGDWTPYRTGMTAEFATIPAPASGDQSAAASTAPARSEAPPTPVARPPAGSGVAAGAARSFPGPAAGPAPSGLPARPQPMSNTPARAASAPAAALVAAPAATPPAPSIAVPAATSKAAPAATPAAAPAPRSRAGAQRNNKLWLGVGALVALLLVGGIALLLALAGTPESSPPEEAAGVPAAAAVVVATDSPTPVPTLAFTATPDESLAAIEEAPTAAPEEPLAVVVTEATATPEEPLAAVAAEATATPEEPTAAVYDTPTPTEAPPTPTAVSTSPPTPTAAPTDVPEPTPEEQPAPPAADLGGTLAIPLVQEFESLVYLTGLDGQGINGPSPVLVTGIQPMFSRDGKRLILNGTEGSLLGVYTTDAKGKSPQMIVDRDSAQWPVFSSNGNEVIFADSTIKDGVLRWTMDGAISEVKANNFPVRARNLLWSDDGQLVFQACAEWSGRAGDCGTWVTDARNLSPTRILVGNSAWPMDARRGLLAYVSADDGDWDIYVMPLNGGEAKNITNNTNPDGLPAIAPDGKSVAYVSNQKGTWSVWTVNLSTGEKQRWFDIDPQRGTVDTDNWYMDRMSWKK